MSFSIGFNLAQVENEFFYWLSQSFSDSEQFWRTSIGSLIKGPSPKRADFELLT